MFFSEESSNQLYKKKIRDFFINIAAVFFRLLVYLTYAASLLMLVKVFINYLDSKIFFNSNKKFQILIKMLTIFILTLAVEIPLILGAFRFFFLELRIIFRKAVSIKEVWFIDKLTKIHKDLLIFNPSFKTLKINENIFEIFNISSIFIEKKFQKNGEEIWNVVEELLLKKDEENNVSFENCIDSKIKIMTAENIKKELDYIKKVKKELKILYNYALKYSFYNNISAPNIISPFYRNYIDFITEIYNKIITRKIYMILFDPKTQIYGIQTQIDNLNSLEKKLEKSSKKLNNIGNFDFFFRLYTGTSLRANFENHIEIIAKLKAICENRKKINNEVTSFHPEKKRAQLLKLQSKIDLSSHNYTEPIPQILKLENFSRINLYEQIHTEIEYLKNTPQIEKSDHIKTSYHYYLLTRIKLPNLLLEDRIK